MCEIYTPLLINFRVFVLYSETANTLCFAAFSLAGMPLRMPRSFPADSIRRTTPSPLNQQPSNLVQGHESVPLRFHRNWDVTIVLSLGFTS